MFINSLTNLSSLGFNGIVGYPGLVVGLWCLVWCLHRCWVPLLFPYLYFSPSFYLNQQPSKSKGSKPGYLKMGYAQLVIGPAGSGKVKTLMQLYRYMHVCVMISSDIGISSIGVFDFVM